MAHREASPMYLLPDILGLLLERLKQVKAIPTSSPIDPAVEVFTVTGTIPGDALMHSNAQIVEEYATPWIDLIVAKAKFGQHPLLPSKIRFKRPNAGIGDALVCDASGVVIYCGVDVVTGNIHLRADFQVFAQ